MTAVDALMIAAGATGWIVFLGLCAYQWALVAALWAAAFMFMAGDNPWGGVWVTVAVPVVALWARARRVDRRAAAVPAGDDLIRPGEPPT